MRASDSDPRPPGAPRDDGSAPPGDVVARGAAANALCMHCALCCDGTFFGSVLVAPEERPRLTRIGLRVVDEDGTLAMPQGCTALRGCLCTVYPDRPKACASYACALREAVVAGDTLPSAAMDQVARMRALIATIREAFGLPATSSVWEAVLAIAEPVPPDPNTPEGRRFDEGIAAVSELLALGRASFEADFGGGR